MRSALPRVDDAAKARVLVAVAAERERDREAARRRMGWRHRWPAIAGMGGVAAAALIAVLVFRSPEVASTPLAAASSAAPVAAGAEAAAGANGTGADVQLATRSASAELARQPVQLVFRDASARSVRVVGDFNAWNSADAPMVRDAQSGLWSVTLLLRPGRHVYAFVVNDSVWVRDPRAAPAPDADFGRPGSVLLVGTP